MTMIETKDLTFAYPAEEGKRSEPALRGVSLGIEKGSFVVVLGHNGSGKSTLAKHMNAVLLPSGGAVYVEGMDTHNQAMLLEIRRRVGMVFQNPDNQIVANVVEEDVAFAPENLGVPPQEIRRRVDDALEAVGMSDFARHAPHLLSGGQTPVSYTHPRAHETDSYLVCRLLLEKKKITCNGAEVNPLLSYTSQITPN